MNIFVTVKTFFGKDYFIKVNNFSDVENIVNSLDETIKINLAFSEEKEKRGKTFDTVNGLISSIKNETEHQLKQKDDLLSLAKTILKKTDFLEIFETRNDEIQFCTILKNEGFPNSPVAYIDLRKSYFNDKIYTLLLRANGDFLEFSGDKDDVFFILEKYKEYINYLKKFKDIKKLLEDEVF